MSKKKNGEKPEAAPKPEPLPQTLKLSREHNLELRYLNEARRRIQLESARLNDDNARVNQETAAVRETLKQTHNGIDILNKYTIDFDTQTATLIPGQAPEPAPAPPPVVEAAEDKEVPEPVASA